MSACFSESDARGRVGAEFVTAVELPCIPAGTRGRVVGARDNGVRGWVVRIKWELPDKRSEYWAQVADFSFNMPWRTKRPVAEFSKSELESLFRPLAPA